MIVLWILLGVLIGATGALPVGRHLLRRVEARARDAERRARESERLAELGAMTGGLAHEIKNPLSTIGLNAQLLREGIDEADLPPDERSRLVRRLDSLSREAERLRGILTDFLQFAGRMKLDPQPYDLRAIVEELGDFFHPQCDRASVALHIQVPDQPVNVRVDERLFKQALLNLMINALQAIEDQAPSTGSGRRGELILRLETDRDTVRIHVMDTGPGIAPDAIDRIFHPYVSDRTGGTGLGLPTTRRIVEEHGGRICVHSTAGQGSDFMIELLRDSE